MRSLLVEACSFRLNTAPNPKLTIDYLHLTNFNRVFELTERTNQLNYAASRISRSHLEAVMMRTGGHRGLVLSASDRFDDYGIIGFALLEPTGWSIESFFMSCRVQRKRVDHAFFGYLLALGAQRGKKRLSANYRQTKRNSPSHEVLEQQMMFRSDEERDGVRIFHHETTDVIPESDIVTVYDRSTLTSSEMVMVGSAHAI
jgi:predicted enzyme involved in methoxymalonyl-ACP biosynthesis